MSAPRYSPIHTPWGAPLNSPWRAPMNAPRHAPWNAPLNAPRHAPWNAPRYAPWNAPSYAPRHAPLNAPRYAPWNAPSYAPRHAPLNAPWNAPRYAPLSAPRHAPIYSPQVAPSHAPTYSPRSFVIVQGVVYCKSCDYTGVDTLMGATPLLGATVKLECKNSNEPFEMEATTDEKGYFFIEAPKRVTNFGAHKCSVSLVESPNASCGKPSNLHGGISGAVLRPEKSYVINTLPFALFTVGPFAFEPHCSRQSS